VADSGDSAFSPASESIVPGAPGTPLDVEVLAGDRQIVVAWTAPVNTTGTIASYKATASPGGATCTTDTGSTTECTITGLTNGTWYTVTVQAIGAGSAGNSAPSAPSARVKASAGPPGSPTAVKAVPNDGTAQISWTAPTGVGDGIARYIATAAGIPDGRNCVTPNGTTLSCVITGLTNQVDYQITVVAIGLGTSGRSMPSTPVTVRPRAVAGAPTNVVVTPGILTLEVAFTPGSVGDGVLNYTATAVGGPSTGPCTTANASTTTCSIKAVTAGTTYTVTVVANGANVGGSSVPSEPSAPVKALAWPAPALPAADPTGTATLLPVTSSAGASLPLNGQTTISGNQYAAFTGIIVGLYQGGTVRKTWTGMTDATGTFTIPVTMSGTGLTTGAATILAGGMQPTGTVRYKSLAMTVTAGTVAALARIGSQVVRTLPAAEARSRRSLVRTVR